MACALSGNSCAVSASPSSGALLFNKYRPVRRQSVGYWHRVKAAASDDAEDCNDEECAPDKEVGKVSMEWLAGERTRVVGTFPPRKKGWTGYVEKDTAGQTNIYSVEPVVYIAESAISSGTAGSSSDGSENTAAIVAGVALISIAVTSSVLLQMGRSPPPKIQTTEYAGPSLTYYINKFKPQEIIEASAPPIVNETLLPSEAVSSPTVPAENSEAVSSPTVPAENSEAIISSPTVPAENSEQALSQVESSASNPVIS